jgi:hypothetical protein
VYRPGFWLPRASFAGGIVGLLCITCKFFNPFSDITGDPAGNIN